MTSAVPSAPGRPRSVAWIVAAGGLVVTVVAAVVAVGLRIADPAPMMANPFGFGDLALVAFETMGIAYAAVGALIMVRRPENLVGWCMVLIGLLHAVGACGAAITSSLMSSGAPGAVDTARVAAWITSVSVTIGGFVLGIGFIFPTGRGHTHTWDLVFRLVLLGGAAVAILVVFHPGPINVVPAIDNPFGIGPDIRPVLGAPVQDLVILTGGLIAILQTWSLISRYKASGDIERQQIKWFASALVVSIGGLFLAMVWAQLTDDPPEVGLATFGFAGTLVPIAIGIAIMRYRLFDIDRIISRTIGYAIITALLGVTFAGLVLGITTAFGSVTESNTIAVAAATLAVFALFQPVRRTVQRSVDRRFNRQRIDAEQATAAFATRLRDELDLGTLIDELARAGRGAVEPSSASIWLRRP
jgi:hypothetical protein